MLAFKLLLSTYLVLFLHGSDEHEEHYVVHQEKKSWWDAQMFCNYEGNKLAETDSAKSLRALRNYIRKNNLLPKDDQSGYWLGGRQEDEEWYWAQSAKNLRGNRENHFMAGWHVGKPDKKQKIFDGRWRSNDECMELQYKNDSDFTRALSWNNLLCKEKRGFICQSGLDIRFNIQ